MQCQTRTAGLLGGAMLLVLMSASCRAQGLAEDDVPGVVVGPTIEYATGNGGCTMRRLTNIFSETACPHKPGFEVRADQRWVGATTSTQTTYGTMADAEAACRNDASCTAFNNLGELVRGIVLGMSVACYPSVCVYIKQVCPEKDGYRLLTHTKPGGGFGSRTLKDTSGSVAEASCGADASCSAWTNKGDRITGNVNTLNWEYGKCAYLKASSLGNVCPPLYGFAEYPNTLMISAGGAGGTKVGALGSSAEAAEMCRVNPRCSAWDSSGRVLLGGVGQYEGAAGNCVYVKNPCPPRAGFTAYNDLTEDVIPPSGRRVELCAADLYDACKADPSCMGFNTLRYMWTQRPSPSGSYPGMCTYVRAPGF